MTCRQSRTPHRWLIVTDRSPDSFAKTLRRLPRGTALLFLAGLGSRDRARMLAEARRRGFVVAQERQRDFARVHGPTELRRALLGKIRLVLISPLYPTRSHPEWRPLPRMRTAALSRLAGRRAIALGGMDDRRFGRVERLGFTGWAGIDAWSETQS